MLKHAFLLAAALGIWAGANSLVLGMSRAPKDHGTPPLPAASPAKPGSPAANPPAAAAATPTPVPINRNAQVIVLGYHRIVSHVRRPDTEISPTDLEAQMNQLKAQGIQVIPLQNLLAWKRGEKDIPARSAVITFDDGWKSQYDTAWPILKKFGYPFTLFIYTDYVRGGPKSGGESISWDQLAEMRDAGVDIQGHTISHHDLTRKPASAHFPDYQAWLWNELNGSKRLLEEHLAIKVNTLAVPYGRYNQQVKEAARRAGYEAIFTVYGQKIGFSSAADALGRYMIESNKPRVFATAVRFDSAGAEAPPAVAEFAPKSMAPQPGDGAVVNDAHPLIKVSVESFGVDDPAKLGMRISGLGKVDAIFDPKLKTLSYKPVRRLGPNTYTVIVTGDGKGGRKEVRWSFSVAEENPVPASSPLPGKSPVSGAVRRR